MVDTQILEYFKSISLNPTNYPELGEDVDIREELVEKAMQLDSEKRFLLLKAMHILSDDKERRRYADELEKFGITEFI